MISDNPAPVSIYIRRAPYVCTYGHMDILCIVVESVFVGFVPGLCTCILRDCVTEDRVFGFMFNEAEFKIR